MDVSGYHGTPIEKLVLEHFRMREILSIFAAQLQQLELGREVDFALAANAVSYMRAFPSRVHHPKEDAIFERLALRDPDCRELVQQILEQHLQIYEIERWLKGMALRRPLPHSDEAKRLVAFGREYQRLQREHCRVEESVLFARAQEVLTQQDWKEMDQAVEAIDDPLSGDMPHEAFQLLHECIVRESRQTPRGPASPHQKSSRGSGTD
jgi:hemerythrin-like domain-containing protein